MFLIAKIVRGRRLLHQLEQEEKEKASKEQKGHKGGLPNSQGPAELPEQSFASSSAGPHCSVAHGGIEGNNADVREVGQQNSRTVG